MGSSSYMDMIRALITAIINASWKAFAATLDILRGISAFRAALIVIAILTIAYTVAHLMQRRLVKKMDKAPDTPVPIWQQELIFSLPGIAVFIVRLPFLLISKAFKAVGKLFSKKKKDEEKDKKPPKPVLVATIGPSFMIAALITTAIYVLAVITEPLIRLHLGASSNFPAWQYMLFGQRQELSWYLPLQNFPYMAVLVCIGFWFTIWWWNARFVRLFLGSELGRNLIKERNDQTLLEPWRVWFGVTNLFAADASYRHWAHWLPIAAIPFLFLAFVAIGGDPYRVEPSMFAISLLLWGSFALNMKLEGMERRGDEEPEEERKAEAVQAKGWADVLQDVRERYQVVDPLPARSPRPIEALPFSSHDARGAGVLSPLLSELLPEPRRFTPMQHAVLSSISLQAYVHTEPPVVRRDLELGGPEGAGVQNRKAMRHRNQIVLAPEGAGKSTLAMLAVCNHALVHTRASLVVVRDEDAVDALHDRMRSVIKPSTLRWNLRARKVGGDLVNDLAQGIIPDVIVCSLHELVVSVLDNPRVYSPFLENLGLIVLDDVESFCGSVEIHAQLAVRRLSLRVRELLGVRNLGEQHAPLMLVLGSDTMYDTPTWTRTLCGIDAVSRYFSHTNVEGEERESAQQARRGVAAAPAPEEVEEASEDAGSLLDPALDEEKLGHHQAFYRLSAFQTATDDPLSVTEIIASCERLAVPWHYRTCGDDRRHLGRRLLPMRDEPLHHTDDPASACVIFLEGGFSAVNREIERLSRAGSEFTSVTYSGGSEARDKARKSARRNEPIAMITIVDSDEEMALTEFNTRSTMADELRGLPRPIVRPPSGRIIDTHLSSELVNNWIEVADVLEVFGNPSSHTLDNLAGAGMLLSERRTDVKANVHHYEDRLHVRALARAVGVDRHDAGHADASPGHLPPKVSQVELATSRIAAVRDRTNLTVIGSVDARSACYIYYPGRIFETAQGRFVVVGSGDDQEPGSGRSVGVEDILVEPYLNDEISSPRRRTRARIVTRLSSSSHGDDAAAAFFAPEPVLMGRFPIAVGLAPVRCTTEHIATFRLGPRFHEVRQRILLSERERAGGNGPAPLETVALCLFPNPEVARINDADCPRLRLREARLIAAAMRAVLPSMYRGAASAIDIAIQVGEDAPEPDFVLESTDGFFLYDLHSGGNGAARAIQRDGVELLLRLARLYLERVLYHDRLKALYDHWGNEDEILAGHAAPKAVEPGGKNNKPGESAADRDYAARTQALEWLDSRLRPEGGAGGRSRAMGHYGSGDEEGEGDVFDIGRCWYSRDGSVTNLLWAKHRWYFEDGTEAAVDIGFDRLTMGESLYLNANSQALAADIAHVIAESQNPGLQLADGTIWGAPRGVWSMGAGEEIPVGSDGNLTQAEPLRQFHGLASAIVAHNWAALEPLARLLRARSKATNDEELVAYLSRFVQGMPNAAGGAPGRNLKSPIYTLLYRMGQADSQSVLLAMLLKHSGIDAGLFYCAQEGRLVTGAALPMPGGVSTWHGEHPHLADRRLLWAELPARPSTGSGTSGSRVFIPVETKTYCPIGELNTEHPEQWVFVPLSVIWERLGLKDGEVTP